MPLPQPFDDRDGLIFYNGNFCEWRSANSHILSHGLHYASCVFEGTRIYSGKIFRNHDHNVRLHKSAEILDLTLPYSAEELDQICIDICKKNGVTNGYIRPFAWRGSEQLQIAARSTKTHLAVACWAWPSYYSQEMKRAGVNLIVSPYRRPPAKAAPVHAKAAGLYTICTLSKHFAVKASFDDAIMLDCDDNVAEGTGANLFVVYGKEIHTPPPDCFLNGITRQTIMAIAPDLGYTIVERKITVQDLVTASDAFLTGTAAEVTKIRSITDEAGNKHDFPDRKVSNMLLDTYIEYVNSGRK